MTHDELVSSILDEIRSREISTLEHAIRTAIGIYREDVLSKTEDPAVGDPALSALPGEAEVWGWAKPDHEEVVPPIAWRGSELPAWATSVFTIPLVPLASLQAMQARAEKAEQERDAFRDMADGYGKLDAELAIAERRAEAAEARVKELEEALEPFVPVYEPWMDNHADNVGLGFYRPATFGDLRRARTALKGGSNG